MEGLNWIFDLTDKVTAPLKEIKKSFAGLEKSIGANEHSIDQVGESINGLRDKLNKYKKNRDEAFRTDHIKKYNKLIQETEKRLGKLENLPSKKHQQNWQNVALGINQVSEVIGKLASSLSFTTEIQALETDIRRFTKLTGDDLDDATKKAHQLGAVYGDSSEEIVRAANAMTKQIGGTFAENLELIEKGYQTGANLNKDLLDQMKEYGPQLKALGLDAAEGMAIMADAAKKGVYSDKAIDALKEANLSLREMGKPQIDALNKIGLSADLLKGKKPFEQIQMISKAMKGADDQARQMILADIFKGAGEDAGFGFIDGLESVDLDINKLTTIKQSGASIKSFVAGIQADITSMMGDVGTYAQTLSSVTPAIMLMTQAYTWLSSSQLASAAATHIVTAAQWLLNIAMTANPLGLIIAAIAVLVGVIYWLTDGFEGFGTFFMGFWDKLTGWFVSAVNFINPFGWLMMLIDYFFPETGVAIREWFSGITSWIMGWVDKIVGFVKDAFSAVAGFFGFGEDEAEVKGEIKHTVEHKTKDQEEEKETSILPKTTTKSKVTSSTASSGVTGGSSTGGRQITVNIENLVKEIVVKSENSTEGVAMLKELVTKALVGSVRDFELTV